MAAPVEVRKVETKSDYKAFFEFPWRHYKDDPNWVPPLLSMRRDLLSKEKNPAWEYMEGDYFTAWRGEQIVGTITAFINHRHNEFHNEHVGWFGTFEVIDDQEAAQALLDTAGAWVKSRGYETMRGPQSFTTHEECGVLIDGFNRPVLLMPYNYPYYRQLIENAGFTKSMDVVSLYYDHQLARENDLNNRLGKMVDRMKQRGGITIRKINLKRKKQEFELFKEIYNDAWDANWGFVPMTEKELDALVESLGMFFDPDFAFFAEVDGKAVGFMLSLPDFNEILHAAYPRPGVPELVSLIKAGWNWKVKRIIHGIRCPLMGVRAEYRNRGIDMALFHATLNALIPAERYEYIDCGWILETNQLIEMCLKLGAKIYKTHRFYEKGL